MAAREQTPLADGLFSMLNRHAPAWMERLRRLYVISGNNPTFAWQALHLASVLPSAAEYPDWLRRYLAEAAAGVAHCMDTGRTKAPDITQAIGLTADKRAVMQDALELRNLVNLLGEYYSVLDELPRPKRAETARARIQAAWKLQSDGAVQTRITRAKAIVSEMITAGGGRPTEDLIQEEAKEAFFLLELTALLERRLATECAAFETS